MRPGSIPGNRQLHPAYFKHCGSCSPYLLVNISNSNQPHSPFFKCVGIVPFIEEIHVFRSMSRTTTPYCGPSRPPCACNSFQPGFPGSLVVLGCEKQSSIGLSFIEWNACCSPGIVPEKQPNCGVEIGARSVALCHLGNIATLHRAELGGSSLRWDPQNWHFINNDAANLWQDYPSPRREGYALNV